MRIYVLVLNTLEPGQKVVQGSHAVLSLTGKTDIDPNDTIIALKATEKQLHTVYFKLEKYGFKCAKFEEPDMDNRITSVATTGDKRLDKFFKQFQAIK